MDDGVTLPNDGTTENTKVTKLLDPVTYVLFPEMDDGNINRTAVTEVSDTGGKRFRGKMESGQF